MESISESVSIIVKIVTYWIVHDIKIREKMWAKKNMRKYSDGKESYVSITDNVFDRFSHLLKRFSKLLWKALYSKDGKMRDEKYFLFKADNTWREKKKH